MISPADVQTNQVSMSRDGQVIFLSGSRSSGWQRGLDDQH